MAETAEQLVVLLEAKVNDFEKNMKKALKSANDNFGGIEDRGRRMGRDLERDLASSTARVNTTLSKLGQGAGSEFGTAIRSGVATALAGLSIGKIAGYIDTDTRIQNSLKVAGLEGEELKKTYDALFQSAQKQGAPLEALTTLYGRLALSQKELNVTAPELVRFTDGVALALKVSGQSAEQASGALLQLSQALGGGKIQSEEYNSLIDGARPVLQAVAAGLEEAGGSVSKLTALVKDGKVSSEAFFRAFEAGRPILDGMAANTAPTIAQEFQRVENALVRVAGEMAKMADAAGLVKTAFNELIGVINQAPAIFAQDLRDLAKITEFVEGIARRIKLAAGTIAILRQEPLPTEEGDPPPLQFKVRPKAPNREIEDTGPKTVKPVSLKSFKVPGDDDGKGGSGAEKIDAYEREAQAIEKRTRAFDSEREALGKSATEAARSEATFKLLEAAKKANVPVTEELKGKVDALATAYAAAKVKFDEAQEAQRRVQETQRYLGNALSDAVSDLLVEGRSLSDVFDSLAKSLAKAAIQAALMGSGPLAGLFGTAAPAGGGLGGLLGSLLGGLHFADGGRVSGPGTSRSDSIPAMLSDGEHVINADAARKNRPLLDAINSGRTLHLAKGGAVGLTAPAIPAANVGRGAGGGSVVTITAPITLNAQGGSKEANADLAKQTAGEVENVMRAIVNRELANQLRPGGLLNH